MRKISLKALQKKKWYKYAKIAYLCTFVVSLVLVISDSTKILRPKFDPINSYILCDNNQQYSLGQHNLTAAGGTLGGADDKAAKRLCMSDERIGELARASITSPEDLKLTNAELGAKIKSSESYIYQNLYLMLTPEEMNYRVVEKYIKPSVLETLGWLILPTLVLLAIFEIELRIFYYLTLGRFLPERPSRYLFLKMKYKH